MKTRRSVSSIEANVTSIAPTALTSSLGIVLGGLCRGGFLVGLLGCGTRADTRPQ
jgi:hypothetical protein